jgi:CRISPR/Cas system CSM-associated protein Csm4 (group 5 of RAMP superfamily)
MKHLGKAEKSNNISEEATWALSLFRGVNMSRKKKRKNNA